MSSKKTGLGVLGSLLALLATGLLIGAGALLWFSGTHRTADGFYTTATVETSTDTYALTSTQLDLGAIRNDWLPADWLATIQVNATPTGDVPVFIGIGPESELRAYLDGVAHAEVTRISDREVTYQAREGEAPPALPSEQEFWAASTEGIGSQSLIWDIEPGQWTMLIMNADAAPDVSVALSAGARTPWLMIVTVGLLIAGLVCAGVAVFIVVLALRSSPAAASEGEAPASPKVPTVPIGGESDTS